MKSRHDRRLTLLYFEIVSTIALPVGLIIVNVVQPGTGMNIKLSPWMPMR